MQNELQQNIPPANSVSKIFPLTSLFLVIVALLIVICGLGIYSFSLNKKYLAERAISSETAADLNLCNSNQAKLLTTSTEQYSPENFRVSSSLFQDKKVIVREWQFHYDKVIEKTINLASESSSGFSSDYPIINVWSQDGSKDLTYIIDDANHDARAIETINGQVFEANNHMDFIDSVATTELVSYTVLHPQSGSSLYIQILGDPFTGLSEKNTESMNDLGKDARKVAESIDKIY